MDVKLIALDLDGTTLTQEKELSPRTRSALDAAAAQGIHIVPVTGRVYAGVPSVIRDLPYVRYVITSNGAEVYDALTQRSLYEACIPLETAMRIYDYLDTQPVTYDCYLDGKGYMPRDWYDRLDEYVLEPHNLEMSRRARQPVDDFRTFLRETGRPLQKLQFFMKDTSRRPAYMTEVPSLFPEVSLSYSLSYNIEVNDRSASKGIALQKLCAHLGIPLEQAAAFGDGLNDVPMLETASVGVAMENAYPEAKAAAKYRTASNQNDGVAQFIERYILK